MTPEMRLVIRGWEDGTRFERTFDNPHEPLDRWDIQSGDSITFHFASDTVLSLHQHPTSNHLGNYTWLSGIIATSFLHSLYTLCFTPLKPPKYHRKQSQTVTTTPFDFDFDLKSIRNVIELGAGCTGLPSLFLGLIGKRVLCTDGFPDVVSQLSLNTTLNTTHSNSYSNADFEGHGGVHPALFPWHDPSTQEKVLSHFFQSDDIDLIILCDCIYSEAPLLDLSRTVRRLYDRNKSKKAPIVLNWSEQRNEAAQMTFLEESKRLGFSIERIASKDWFPFVAEQCRLDYINFYVMK